MICIYNGRTRSLSGTRDEVWAQVDVSLRSHIREFKQGTNLNPWAVFTVLALHANADGWSFPSTELLKEETGLSTDEAITSALTHLRNLKIDGRRILDHYRVKGKDNRWGKSYYRIFPEADEAKPPAPDLILWNPVPPPGIPGVEIPALEMGGDSLSKTTPEVKPSEENTFAKAANAVSPPAPEPPSQPKNLPEAQAIAALNTSLQKMAEPTDSPREEPKEKVPPKRKGSERKPWSDLTDAMHQAIPEAIRPVGRPHYGVNDKPAREVYEAGLTAQDVTEYVAWVYVHDKWFCCGGPGGIPVLITMHKVKESIRAWKVTKGANGNASISGYSGAEPASLRAGSGAAGGTYSAAGSGGSSPRAPIPSIIPAAPGIPRSPGLLGVQRAGSDNA